MNKMNLRKTVTRNASFALLTLALLLACACSCVAEKKDSAASGATAGKDQHRTIFSDNNLWESTATKDLLFQFKERLGFFRCRLFRFGGRRRLACDRGRQHHCGCQGRNADAQQAFRGNVLHDRCLSKGEVKGNDRGLTVLEAHISL